MRTVKIQNMAFAVRALARGEVKKLRHDGIDLNQLNLGNAQEAVDRVLEMVFDEQQLAAIDRLPNPDAMRLWREILKETFGAEDEEKNSLRSGSGSQTANGSNIAGPAAT